MKQICIHGGILGFEGGGIRIEDYQQELGRITAHARDVLYDRGAREAVVAAIVELEDCEIFNAGTGSRLQSDGEIRMTASLMDGRGNRFSGVINVQRIKNPILVAAHLAQEENTVLAGPEATQYAREIGFGDYDPSTDYRVNEQATGEKFKTGTVGAVAIDDKGDMFAGTSTGGTGNEIPGRVSDSGTVAGTYANEKIAISCTGAGEEIVNMGVAASIATRVNDGKPSVDAVALHLEEARVRNYFYGLIAVESDGRVITDRTDGTLLYAHHDGDRIVTFNPAR